MREQEAEPGTRVTGRASDAATGPRSGGNGSVRLTPQARADEKTPSLPTDDHSVENLPFSSPWVGRQAHGHSVENPPAFIALGGL